MLHIKVNATSANVCVGFDTLGLALDLANEFMFEEALNFEFYGFEEEYCNIANNLLYDSYKYTFDILKKDIVTLKIGFKGKIPVSRGLGSSSSLIVAGVMAAVYYAKAELSLDEIFNICVELEGHPDNVAPAIYGGLVASYCYNSIYFANSYEVNNDLCFTVIIPSYELKTADARAVLPNSISYKSVVNNLSRIVNIPKALAAGDLEMLKRLFIDCVHEPYRQMLIKEYEEVKQICQVNDAVLAISGSGSTMLVISKNTNIIEKFKHLSCDIKTLNIGSGVLMWEDKYE